MHSYLRKNSYSCKKWVLQGVLHSTLLFASSGICISCSLFCCIWGAKRRCTIFHAWVGPVWIQQNVHWDTLRRTLVFYPVGSESRSAFWSIRDTKCRHTIFHARVGSVRIPEKACRDTLCQTCVFASCRIYDSLSAFKCVRGMTHRRTIFHAQVGSGRIP
jgi:hypothetical protein